MCNLTTVADRRLRAYLPSMAKGIYRTVDGFVQVDFGTHSTPMPRARYQEEGYQPPFETLPSEPDYFAAQQKAQNGAKRPLIEDTAYSRSKTDQCS